MRTVQKIGLGVLVGACLIGSLDDAIRILTLLCTLALVSYISKARAVDRASR